MYYSLPGTFVPGIKFVASPFMILNIGNIPKV